MDNFANTEDPDEMLRKVVFHKVLHCLLRQKIQGWGAEEQ